jgi:hypothetical protein
VSCEHGPIIIALLSAALSQALPLYVLSRHHAMRTELQTILNLLRSRQ